jgi:hypothetical protein
MFCFWHLDQAGLPLSSGFICYELCPLGDQTELSIHTAVCVSA